MGKESDALRLTADQLKGKQSVRATFRLSEEVIRLLSLTAAQLGIKQKTLFDQLIEDQKVLDQIASQAERSCSPAAVRQQKTYVLSRNSLVSLERVARQHRMPRDMLVEISIQRLQPVLDLEQKKQRKRRQALHQVEEYCSQGRQLLLEVGRVLGADDPVSQYLADSIHRSEKNLSQIRDIVRQGQCLEDL
ncbi:MAG: hypothetical protein CSA33_04270 [Desulfobulbus propionicus]|nr:MAG: hypothetical protein CSA33_04270 [Desulfobulbus propionicus]